MRNGAIHRAICLALTHGLLVWHVAGCNTARYYRQQADQTSYKITEQKQKETLGRTERFTIEQPADTLRRRLLLDQKLTHAGPASLGTADIAPIKQWPDDDYLKKPIEQDSPVPAWQTDRLLRLTLIDALQIGARNNRDYQSQKEQVFQAALDLDLERDFFRYTWAGRADSLREWRMGQEITIDDEGNTERQTITGTDNSGEVETVRRFKNGMTFTGLIGLDLVKLLSQDRTSSRGVFADTSISIPLLRGSSKFVVTEPLTQAEREVVYAIYDFDRFKRVFAVTIASEYLAVLQELDRLKNAEENYRRLIASTRLVRRLADAGRRPEIQVDQAQQDELRARNRWISSREAYERRMDAFKLRLGLPTDAAIELAPSELQRLDAAVGDMHEPDRGPETQPEAQPETQPEAQPETQPEAQPETQEQSLSVDAPIELVEPSRENAGPLELEESRAVKLALDYRLDLRVAVGRVDDAQRGVAVAADALRADLTLLGSASLGERRTLANSHLPNGNPQFSRGRYSALLGLDLPLERTAERNAYRNSLIDLEQAVRDVQELEDQIKLETRSNLRTLEEARESLRIQAESVRVARRRVTSTDLFLQAGRAEVRDVLEAQEALVSAQNARTSALVQYRVAELALQRDIGLLEVDENGLWQEFDPKEMVDDDK